MPLNQDEGSSPIRSVKKPVELDWIPTATCFLSGISWAKRETREKKVLLVTKIVYKAIPESSVRGSYIRIIRIKDK